MLHPNLELGFLEIDAEKLLSASENPLTNQGFKVELKIKYFVSCVNSFKELMFISIVSIYCL